MLRRTLVVCAVSLVTWALVGVIASSREYVASAERGRAAAWWPLVASWLRCYGIWALLTPPVWFLTQRLPLTSRQWLRRLPLYAAAACAFLLASRSLFALGAVVWRTESVQAAFDPERLLRSIVLALHSDMAAFAGIVLAGHFALLLIRHKERERRAAQLESMLRLAQLETLKMQLNPHFLFNTLNTIGMLMREDVKRASRVLTELSDLLRKALDNAGTQETPLRDELALLRHYLEIEQTRFGDRLRIALHVAPEALDVKVPFFILQPLVENALRHGVARRPGPGAIEIRAVRREDQLEIEILDNGEGVRGEPVKEQTNGIGLANTQARLERLYGPRYCLRLIGGIENGFGVAFSVPWKTA